MARELQPAPLEPTRSLLESTARGDVVPLVHATRIEQQGVANHLRVDPMRVSEDDDVGVGKSPAQAARQASVWPEVAEGQRPQERLRLLEPARPVAMDERESLAGDRQLARSEEHTSELQSPVHL